MTQGAMSAEFYFCEAVNAIERKFGEGTAKQFPDLIAAFMRIASEDERFFRAHQLAEAEYERTSRQEMRNNRKHRLPEL